MLMLLYANPCIQRMMHATLAWQPPHPRSWPLNLWVQPRSAAKMCSHAHNQALHQKGRTSAAAAMVLSQRNSAVRVLGRPEGLSRSGQVSRTRLC